MCDILVLVGNLGKGLRFVLAVQTNLCFLGVDVSHWGQPVPTARRVERAVLVYSWEHKVRHSARVSKPSRVHAAWVLLVWLAVLVDWLLPKI
jgi:hypothetical protein